MTQSRFTDLPTVSNASLTDIVCAVQGYMSPSVLGISVQETWQQVFNLFTQNLGNATAESIIFSPTTKGIIGTTNADNASTGFVGEYIFSNVQVSSGISLTNATPANVTSINLSAGDWDVYGNVTVISTLVALESVECWCGLVSASPPDFSMISTFNGGGTDNALRVGLMTPFLRVSISSTTTVYLSTMATFTGGSNNASGSIFARRVR